MGWEGAFVRLQCDRCGTVEEYELYDKHGTHYPMPDDEDIESWGWKTGDEADVLLCESCELWVDLPISSSAITQAAYFPEAEVLKVEFPSGSVYAYEGVPKKVISALKRAKSAGQYFNKASARKRSTQSWPFRGRSPALRKSGRGRTRRST